MGTKPARALGRPTRKPVTGGQPGHETQSGVFGYKTRQGFGTTYTQAGDLAVEELFRKGITTAREISRCLRGHEEVTPCS